MKVIPGFETFEIFYDDKEEMIFINQGEDRVAFPFFVLDWVIDKLLEVTYESSTVLDDEGK